MNLISYISLFLKVSLYLSQFITGVSGGEKLPGLIRTSKLNE